MRCCEQAFVAAVAVTLLAAPAGAAAQSSEISGTLDQPGYTVIALAADGEVKSVVAPSGAFSLAPPAPEVTLHLRGPDGTYAGPVVLEPEANFELQDAKRAASKANRKQRSAKHKVKSAKRKLRKADPGEAKRRARKALKRAKRKLRKTQREQRQAGQQLEAAEAEDADRPNWAVLGLRAGAQLGQLSINGAAGYARSAAIGEQDWERWVQADRRSRAVNGVPIGAGNFGLVASAPSPGTVPGDPDLDGVPDPLDVDDDGNLILDNIDGPSADRRARGTQAPGCGPDGIYCQNFASSLPLFMQNSVNANARDSSGAPAFTDSQIDATLAGEGFLGISATRGDEGYAELDCGGAPDPDDPGGWIGGLGYCTRGGSGRAAAPSEPRPAFPGPAGGQFDPDGDGFGTLDPSVWPEGAPHLRHGATTAELKTGDVLIHRFISGGAETESSGTLQYVFATVPALVSYSDTAGNSANIAYPVGPGGPGTGGNGLPVSAPAGEDVLLTLTFWRPQRRPIGGETGNWIDVGHLTYGATTGSVLTGACPDDAFLPADPPDPNLTLTPSNPRPIGGGWGFTDTKDDQAAAPESRLTYRLNLTRCLAANGLSFNSGEVRAVQFMAAPGKPDAASQTVFFKRQ